MPHLAGEPIGPKALGGLLDSACRREARRQACYSLLWTWNWVGIGVDIDCGYVAPVDPDADVGPGRRRLDRQCWGMSSVKSVLEVHADAHLRGGGVNARSDQIRGVADVKGPYRRSSRLRKLAQAILAGSAAHENEPRLLCLVVTVGDELVKHPVPS